MFQSITTHTGSSSGIVCGVAMAADSCAERCSLCVYINTCKVASMYHDLSKTKDLLLILITLHQIIDVVGRHKIYLERLSRQ